MKKYILMLVLAFGIFAQATENNETDFFSDGLFAPEDSLSFGDSFLIDESPDDTSIADITGDLLGKSISFTGKFGLDANYSSYEKGSNIDNFNSSIKSDLFLDVRLNNGVKAYTSLKLVKSNNDNTLVDEVLMDKIANDPFYKANWNSLGTNGDFLSLNEMFFDYNFDQKVYVRLGKQNLAWGRGYFFNPSDLINVGSKSLDDLMGNRTGNYGVKIHIPEGVSKNFYTYIKMEDKKNVEDLDLALKYEFLVGKTEYSVAAVRLGEEKATVVSADFASSYKGAQTFGEFTLQNGKEITHYTNGVEGNLDGKIIGKASLGYSKTFDKIGKDEDEKTIMLIQEFYYNGAGYSKDGEKDYSLYNPYSEGQLYLANFITFGNFINKDTTISLNLLSGFSDSAHQLSGLYSYSLNDDVTLGTSLMGYFSTKDSSVISKYLPKYSIGLSAEISF